MRLSALHRRQLGWRPWLRTLWWTLLLPLALLCWSGSQPNRPVRVLGRLATGLVALVWAAVIIGSSQQPSVTTASVAQAPLTARLSPHSVSPSPLAPVAPTSEQPSAGAATVPPPASPTAVPVPVVTTPPPVPATPPVVVAPSAVVVPPVVVAPPLPAHTPVVVPVPRVPVQRSPAAAPRTPAPPQTTAPQAPAPSACTTTAKGTCIQGGEFCPVAKEGTIGTDADGRSYTCLDGKGNGHPHWE